MGGGGQGEEGTKLLRLEYTVLIYHILNATSRHDLFFLLKPLKFHFKNLVQLKYMHLTINVIDIKVTIKKYK